MNTGAIVDPFCSIGVSNPLTTGAILSGQVQLSANVNFCTGYSINWSVIIVTNVVIGAGATVTIHTLGDLR